MIYIKEDSRVILFIGVYYSLTPISRKYDKFSESNTDAT